MRVDLFLDQVNDLVLTLNEWRLPDVRLTFKLYVKKAGPNQDYEFLATGQGNFDLYFGCNIKKFLLSLSMIVVV
jgi:hypothetical protein